MGVARLSRSDVAFRAAEECVRLATSGERVVEANGRAPSPRAASSDSTLAHRSPP
jgi:hypothetical protein